MKVILFFLSSLSLCYAQQSPKEKIIGHFDKNWKTVASQSAAYFRTMEILNDRYVIRDYFISGNLYMEAACSAYKPELAYDGKRVTYYEDGVVKTQGFYADNKEIGTHQTFYRNGKTQMMITFNNKKRIEGFYSPEGNNLLEDGSAIVLDSLSPSKTPFLEIINHQVAASFAIENNDTIYSTCDKIVDYKGGLARFAKDMTDELEYPMIGQGLKLEGIVFILVRFAKDGNITKASVLRGFDPTCNAEALRAVKALNFWNPAQHHSKPVISQLVVPVRFRLKNELNLEPFILSLLREGLALWGAR